VLQPDFKFWKARFASKQCAQSRLVISHCLTAKVSQMWLTSCRGRGEWVLFFPHYVTLWTKFCVTSSNRSWLSTNESTWIFNVIIWNIIFLPKWTFYFNFYTHF
jgi:hypothetical protein